LSGVGWTLIFINWAFFQLHTVELSDSMAV